MASILVINPNSNTEVTRGIDAALEPLKRTDGPRIEVVGLTGTPHGIESQQDVDAVANPVAERVRAETSAHDAFVVACFSDPGLHSAKEVTDKPVFGIAQVGMLTAMALGARVGVISILPTSIPRHWRYYRALGIADAVAGDLAVGASVAELANEAAIGQRMTDVGQRLKDDHQADALVLGCAGMARYREPLEQTLGIPVVDPTQAAVGFALAAVALKYTTS